MSLPAELYFKKKQKQQKQKTLSLTPTRFSTASAFVTSYPLPNLFQKSINVPPPNPVSSISEIQSVIPLLSAEDVLQDAQWATENKDSTEPYYVTGCFAPYVHSEDKV